MQERRVARRVAGRVDARADGAVVGTPAFAGLEQSQHSLKRQVRRRPLQQEGQIAWAAVRQFPPRVRAGDRGVPRPGRQAAGGGAEEDL